MIEKVCPSVWDIISSGRPNKWTALNNSIIWIASFYIHVAAITSTGVDAVSGVDFTPLTQVTFMSGTTEKCVDIPILINAESENTETFTLTIDAGQNHIIVGSPNVVTVSIIDSTCKFHCSFLFTYPNMLIYFYTFKNDVDL